MSDSLSEEELDNEATILQSIRQQEERLIKKTVVEKERAKEKNKSRKENRKMGAVKEL